MVKYDSAEMIIIGNVLLALSHEIYVVFKNFKNATIIAQFYHTLKATELKMSPAKIEGAAWLKKTYGLTNVHKFFLAHFTFIRLSLPSFQNALGQN